MYNIPEDVVSEILVRLSVKCLLKFRCVCKAWRGLIGSPGFIDFHLGRHQNQKGYGYGYGYLLLACKNEDEVPVLSFYSRGVDRKIAPDFPAFDEPMTEICGPCNGIVCVMVSSTSLCSPGLPSYDPNGDVTYLVNPSTRESRRLPDRPFGVPPLELAYYRKRMGFGFDSRNNEYKVVSVMAFKRPQGWMHMIEIYELRSNSWRVAADTPIPPTWGVEDNDPFLYPECGLFFNGWLHWMASNVIIGFDLSNEVLVEISYPEDEYENSFVSRNHPCVLEDCLALVVGEVLEFCTRIVIWVMKEESWIKRFRLGTFPSFIYPLIALNDDMLLAEDLKAAQLVSLHIDLFGEDHKLKKHSIYSHSFFHRKKGVRLGAIVMQKESLVSLR